MFNDIHIGPLTLHMYGLMIAIGFMFAYYLCEARAKKNGLDEDTIFGILICAIVGGLLGCKILYYITVIPDIIKNPSILFRFNEGFVVYGGIIGGVLASWIYVKKKGQEFADYFDLVMPAVSGAQGFGRLGCFFAGCCYGAETDSWFHIVFKNSSYAPNGVKLLPTQLMSSVGDFLIMTILLIYAKKKPLKARVGAMYMMLYGVGRFVIEFFRNDYRGNVGPLSTSQLISIGIVIAGVILFVIAKNFKCNNIDASKSENASEDSKDSKDSSKNSE